MNAFAVLRDVDSATLVGIIIVLLVGYLSLLATLVQVVIHRNRAAKEARRSHSELIKARATITAYGWWLAGSPGILLTLENLQQDIRGSARDASWPPGDEGPWDIGGLREVLRRRELL